jgi:hypothetical protein
MTTVSTSGCRTGLAAGLVSPTLIVTPKLPRWETGDPRPCRDEGSCWWAQLDLTRQSSGESGCMGAWLISRIRTSVPKAQHVLSAALHDGCVNAGRILTLVSGRARGAG